MLEACRTCLRLIDLENLPFYEIEDDDVQLSSESTRLKLLSFIPEMALDITPKSMLCAKCHKRLEAVFEFKTECLQTEKIIMHYLKTKLNLNIKNLDLKDVSAFNAADIKIIGNETVEVSAVKEDMEVYDSVITNLKEEVDDFLLESSNIVQSMTDVPCSLTDTRISEEEAVEASVEDEAVKDEIEVCDTVITNLKDDADDFLPRPSTDVWIGEEEAVGASVEDDTVKNEMEVCDIVITNLKDKARDFLSESVEVAQLTMAMAGSSTDIRVSKDKADTLDEEMEVCDSVITNLTDKAGDFSTKSVKVARPKNTVPRTHTGEKPYRCETCKCSFTKKTNLTRHLRIHTGKRLYICTFCDKAFNQNHSLTEHMRIHTGKIPYHCEMCNCSFTNKRNLTRHLRIHTGERPYICTFCDKGFYQNYSLTEHMRIHTGERPYHCEICDGRFQRNTHLKKHLRTHTGEQSYVCTTCGQAYTSKFILNKHKCTSNIEKLHK